MRLHLGDPLGDEASRGDDEDAGGPVPEGEFFDDEAGLDGLAEPDFVGEEAADGVAAAGPGEGGDLVGERGDGGEEGGEERCFCEVVEYPPGCCACGHLVFLQGRGLVEGGAGGCISDGHGVCARDPEPAGGRAPDLLGLDHLDGFSVLRAPEPSADLYLFHVRSAPAASGRCRSTSGGRRLPEGCSPGDGRRSG